MRKSRIVRVTLGFLMIFALHAPRFVVTQRKRSTIFLLALFSSLFTLLPPSAYAQYTANSQTNTISGVASNWAGAYTVGSNYVFDALQITGGGVLSNGNGRLGYTTSSSNNSAVVSGAGSTWSNAATFSVGYYNSGSSLVISNGGKVFNPTSYIGANIGTYSNSVLVSDASSAWNSSVDCRVGQYGYKDSLVISNGGMIFSPSGYVGYNVQASNNTVLVTGSGSTWSNTDTLAVGYNGARSSLTISNAGAVVAPLIYLGYAASSTNNTLTLAGGNLTVSSTQDICRGTFTLNSGTNTANVFLATNGTSSVVTYNGGYITNKFCTFTNSAVLNMALGTSSQPWIVASNLALACTLNITDAGGFAAGTYNLFTYGGSLLTNAVTIGTTPDATLVYAINTNTVGYVKLTATSTNAVTSAGGWPFPFFDP